MYSDCIFVYVIDLDPPSKFLGTKRFAAQKFCDCDFVALAWLMSRSFGPSGLSLFLTHTTRHWRISSFVCLVVLPQYN